MFIFTAKMNLVIGNRPFIHTVFKNLRGQFLHTKVTMKLRPLTPFTPLHELYNYYYVLLKL